MRITKEAVPLIENALGIKLFPWQINYLINNEPFPIICPCLIKQFENNQRIRERCMASFNGKCCQYIGRITGKTTAQCIRIALSDGNPIIIDRYKLWWKHFFFDIWFKLRDAGFSVRKIKFEGTENHEKESI